MLVKILGAIDLLGSICLLAFIFGYHPHFQFVLFCAGLLFMKGMFILTGDFLSVIDIYSAVILILSIWFHPPTMLLWIGAFLLLSKGFVSFV